MSDEKTTAVVKVGEQRTVLLEEIRVVENVRKDFDPEEMAELQESIRTIGLRTPLSVRPIAPTTDKGDKAVKNFELVAGEKRIRCCRALGHDQVMCVVMELSDLQALEWQLIENLQRGDLNLLEEAAGYEKLMALGEYSAKDLAAKVSKSPKYIYERLKLSFLPVTGRAALLDGRMSFKVARQIACLPHDDWRVEAVKIVLDPAGCKVQGLPNNYWDHPKGESLTGSQTTELLTTRYMRELKTAPFDLKDASLVPAAGPCTTCPKRAGNAPELFPHLRGDMCTDLKCYAGKQEAKRLLLVASAKAKGQKVMTSEERDKVMYSHSGGEGMKHDSPYVRLTDEPSYSDVQCEGKTPKWSALVKGQEVPVVLAVGEDGKVHELVERKLALLAGKTNRPELFRARGTSVGSASGKAEAEKRKREEAMQREVFADVMDALQVKIEQGKCEKNIGDVFVSALLDYAFDLVENSYDDTLEAVCKRRKLVAKDDDWDGAMVDEVKSMNDSPSHKLALALELILTRDDLAREGSGNIIFEKAYKIDRQKIESQVKESFAVIDRLAKAKLPGAKSLAKKTPPLGTAAATKKPAPAIKKAASKSTPATKSAGKLGERIVRELKAAGTAGLTVKDLSFKLGVKPGNCFAWFYTSGKKVKNAAGDLAIRKIGEARYAFVEKAGAK